MKLRVVRISAGATLQDSGRPGWRHCGVPPGGAFDRESLALANALIGNSFTAPALELTMLGGVFECIESGVSALAGGDCEWKLNGELQPTNSAVGMNVGDTIEIGAITKGVRVYLSATGGWIGEEILGSVSGHVVSAGSLLESSVSVSERKLKLSGTPSSLRTGAIRVFPSLRSQDVFQKFSKIRYRVSLNSDRKGVRLDGPQIGKCEELPSEPVCVGTIQLTPSGELIVIGPDGPTIGGYPKIAYVCEADLDRIGQLRPGNEVTFEQSTVSPKGIL